MSAVEAVGTRVDDGEMEGVACCELRRKRMYGRSGQKRKLFAWPSDEHCVVLLLNRGYEINYACS